MYIIAIKNNQCLIGYLAKRPNKSHIIIVTHNFTQAIHYFTVEDAAEDLKNIPFCYSFDIIKISGFRV